MREELSKYDKLYNSIVCLSDLIRLENKLIEKDRIDEIVQLSDEKEFLTNMVLENKSIIFNVLRNEEVIAFSITKDQYSSIKEAASTLLTLTEENARLIGKRLYVINVILSSIQRVAKKEENKLALYGSSGKNLNFSNKVGSNAFKFNSTI
ncbi:MAG: hypothetical protein MRQ09_00085 [Candidatus Midichloria sp.]|nr:hypothetical protein [Candidatus Midichloria sp.]